MRIGRTLIILQVALSMVLLAGAGLFVRSLHQLESVDLGFVREGILTMEVAPERQMHGTPEWLQLQSEILRRIRLLPGVRSAGWATMNPLSGRDRGVALFVPGFVPEGARDNDIHLVSASPDYFETCGIPLLLGRTFTERDHQGAPKVAILNETAARFYFGHTSPVGRRVGFRPGDPDFEIVGVVKDVKHESIRKEPWRFIYLAIPQSIDRINRLALAVRGSGDSTALAGTVQREIRGTRSSLLITNISTMEKQVHVSLMRERLVATLSIAFGALALVLACIGLYGILAYAVARRTNEIGIRMALGASRIGVVWLVLREALVLASAGIGIGVPASLALGRITETFLYGVDPFDIPALASTALLLLVFAVIAAILPARRASQLDPMAALRSE
jgi:predicted permease